MGKKKSNTPGEEHLLLPTPPTALPIVDTHTHIASTFQLYQSKYNKEGQGKFPTVFDFVKGVYKDRNVESIVDVWCQPAVYSLWKEFADSAVTEEDRKSKWDGIDYWFVIGVHPHEAKSYNDEVERQILEAIEHPRCVGWGEMGLDYHYDNSPRDVQQAVFARQLRHAVRLGKPLTIHTREAEQDTERILKEIVPQDHKIHVHCFTDSPEFAARLLDHFPNLYIGITGVISYSTNLNTSAVIRNLLGRPPPSTDDDAPIAVGEVTQSDKTPNPDAPSASSTKLRILLETDAPYMVPANLYESLPAIKGKKLPLCHTAMIPWVAAFVAGVAGEGWTTERVMTDAKANAREVYGV